MSLFGGIQTALSGLRAQQIQVETTTQNIANADNPDYSRQQVDLVANPPYPPPALGSTGPGQIGTGVSVASINRITDSFTTTQLRLALAQQAAGSVAQDTTAQIEAVFDEMSGHGISSLLSQFWNSWQDLSSAPTDPGARTNVVAQAQALAAAFQQSVSQLDQLRQGLDQQVGLQVSQLNTLAGQVAELNRQITMVEVTGEHANDLRDQRDALIRQIYGIAGVSVTDLSNGAVRISIAGVPLVDGTTVTPLSTVPNGSGTTDIVGPNGTVIQPSSGSLAGILQMRDQEIPSRLNALNAVAARLIAAVNAVHSGTGPPATNVYDLVTPNTPVSRNFFVGTDASNIAVNPAIVQDPNLIAASRVANGPGDGSNALAIAALQRDPSAGGAPPGSPTIDGQYQELATAIGNAAATAKNDADNQQVLVSHLQQRQAQIAGVSLDEEAAHLISYQRAYEAAARALTTFDAMLDKLINDTGIVGR
ncbi:MAG: flagellar hook-associated protein FlgK [Chloroflexi bacterium]|nr:flagellar hook-associated protein FlgK [Chloroflexota bacterium]